MKNLLALLCCITLLSFTVWETDYEKARQLAKEKHALILLNFSGSDWFEPCIRMRKDVFESPVFSAMADTSLVLVNADFPRNRKNKISEQVKKQNELLADKYNP